MESSSTELDSEVVVPPEELDVSDDTEWGRIKRKLPIPFCPIGFAKWYAKKITGKDEPPYETVRELAESLEKSYKGEVDFYRGVLHTIYEIAASENPSEWRTKILNCIEVALFGRVLDEEDEDL